MKKLFPFAAILIFLFSQSTITSCTKTVTKTITDTVTKTITDTVTKTDTVVTYPIQGLWIGTYTAAVNGNVPYYFSFTVYPDSTLSYVSHGTGNTTFYAYGTWSLSGTTFSFSVVEISSGDTQTGTATYNSTNGKLTNGTISDPTAGTSATWAMDKIN